MELMITLLQQHGSHPGPAVEQPFATSTVQKRSKKTGKMDKEHWANLLVAIGDSQQFMEMIRGLRWEEGLSVGALHLIKSRLSMAHLESECDTADGTKNGGNTLESSSDQLITISAARHASKGVASMCIFAVSIVDYHHKLEAFKKVQVRFERLRRDLASKLKSQVLHLQSDASSLFVYPVLQREMTMRTFTEHSELPHLEEEEEGASDEEIEEVQRVLSRLQLQFDEAVMGKHQLTRTCQQLTEKLKLAQDMLERYSMYVPYERG